MEGLKKSGTENVGEDIGGTSGMQVLFWRKAQNQQWRVKDWRLVWGGRITYLHQTTLKSKTLRLLEAKWWGGQVLMCIEIRKSGGSFEQEGWRELSMWTSGTWLGSKWVGITVREKEKRLAWDVVVLGRQSSTIYQKDMKTPGEKHAC